MTLSPTSFSTSTRTYYDDLRRHLSVLNGISDISVTDVPSENSLVLRFEVLGQMEKLRFTSNVEPRDVAHAIWLLRETRLAAVGPEFHMHTKLAQLPFAPVDPFGRPV